MTTKRELVEWLAQFDDDMEIEVVTVRNHRGAWSDDYNITETELILSEIKLQDISWDNSYFSCLEFQDLDVEWVDGAFVCKGIGKLVLGRSDL